MNIKSLYSIYFIIAIAVCIVVFPDGFSAIVLSITISLPLIFVFSKSLDKREDLIKLFLVALILRTIASSAMYYFRLEDFFALDWRLYNELGYELANYWSGETLASALLQDKVLSFSGTVWGISLLVGSVYSLVGRNLLAAQLVIATIGAAIAPVTYLFAFQIYSNRRVALIAGFIVAFSPSLILWSSLILKDTPIIFFLVLTMYLALKLHEKFDYKLVIVLLLALFGVMSLRYYIFYVVAVAVIGGFVIGQKNTVLSMIGRSAVVILVGVTLGYLGILNNAQSEVTQMTSLEVIQISRNDLANSAASGFGEDYDVSTVEGSIRVLPVGFTYLLLSPLPWQFTSSLSLMTLPEMLVWWSMLPLLIVGIIYSVRHRLRKCISVLVFTIMLTLAYSILQGNVGTAYRQRAQIQIFLFIFISVGWVIKQERNENRKTVRLNRRN